MNRRDFIGILPFLSAALYSCSNIKTVLRELYEPYDLHVPINPVLRRKYRLDLMATKDELNFEASTIQTPSYHGSVFDGHTAWQDRTGLDTSDNYRVYKIRAKLLQLGSGESVPIYDNAQTVELDYYENQRGRNPGIILFNTPALTIVGEKPVDRFREHIEKHYIRRSIKNGWNVIVLDLFPPLGTERRFHDGEQNLDYFIPLGNWIADHTFGPYFDFIRMVARQALETFRVFGKTDMRTIGTIGFSMGAINQFLSTGTVIREVPYRDIDGSIAYTPVYNFFVIPGDIAIAFTETQNKQYLMMRESVMKKRKFRSEKELLLWIRESLEEGYEDYLLPDNECVFTYGGDRSVPFKAQAWIIMKARMKEKSVEYRSFAFPNLHIPPSKIEIPLDLHAGPYMLSYMADAPLLKHFALPNEVENFFDAHGFNRHQ